MAIGSNRYTEVWKGRHIRMSDELYEKLRKLAKEKKIPIAELVRIILSESLDE